MNSSNTVVGVVAKQSHPDSLRLMELVFSALRQNKVDYLVCADTAAELNLSIPAEQLVKRELLTQTCSPIVVLGGDGTLISVCRHAAPKPPVILGVNLGTLGFLTEITSEELPEMLEATLNGSAKLEQRTLLDVAVIRNGQEAEHYNALNDVVLTKAALARIYGIDLAVDGDSAALIRGDGCIVATPGGSTAYSLAAGGSIVHPQVDALLITPICPHSLTSRPLVVPGRSEISLTVDEDASGSNVFLTIDGQEGMPLKSGDQVVITTSENKMFFVKSQSKNYYEILGAKLKWANR